MSTFMVVVITITYIFIIRFAHGFLCRYWDIKDGTDPSVVLTSLMWPITLAAILFYNCSKLIPVHDFGDRFAKYLMTPRKVRVDSVQRTEDEHMFHDEAMQEVEETLDQNNFYMK